MYPENNPRDRGEAAVKRFNQRVEGDIDERRAAIDIQQLCTLEPEQLFARTLVFFLS